MGRPRVLDEGKQREVCALLTAGMTINEAAAYVGCCEKTIRREQRRDEGFDERVRRARMAARLGPLQAVRQAAATHWRAAAWLVDRQDRQEERERRARRERIKRQRQRAQAKAEAKQQPWDLEREIQQIAAARPAAGEPDLAPESPRRQPGEPSPTAAPTESRRSPVAAAMKRLAKQVAATAQGEPSRQGEPPGQGTKPPVRPAAEPAAEPAMEAPDAADAGSDAEGFVPSLRIFGQNDEGHAAKTGEPAGVESSAKPPAPAGGCGANTASAR